MKKIKTITYSSIMTVLILSLWGCGGSDGSTNHIVQRDLSVAGANSLYYNQEYTYTATLSNLGDIAGAGLSDCALHALGDGANDLMVIDSKTVDNQCIFNVKDNNISSVDQQISLSATANYAREHYQSDNTLQVMLHHKKVTPPPPPISHNYWRLNLPGNTTFPTYVYNSQHQLVAYVESLSQPIFLMPTDTNDHFQIISQTAASGYRGCELSISSANKVTGSCPHISQPELLGNELMISYGASTLPAVIPKVPPMPPQYKHRGIIFKNDLDVPVTIKGSGDNELFEVGAHLSYEYFIPDTGLSSHNFRVVKIGNQSVNHGASFTTLLEMTYPSLDDKEQFANFDVSMVDGYNIRYKFYPVEASYFTYDFAMGQTIQAVGYYSQKNPASIFDPKQSLQAVCQQIDAGMHQQDSAFPIGSFIAKAVDSAVVVGCYSPRTVARIIFGPNSDLFHKYGCVSPYGTPQTCTVAARSVYVRNVHDNATRGYAYPYDDWFADYSADRHTSLVFEILPPSQRDAN